MAVRIMPGSGQPDDSGVEWSNDADLPGQFQGGGQGFRWGDTDIPGNFGKGGFSPTGRTLTAPTTPPRGLTLAPTSDTPLVPQQPVNRGASGPGFGVGWRNPFTAPHVDPTTGQPELLSDPNLSSKSNIGGWNPASLLGGGNPYWRAIIAAGGAVTPTPAETGELPLSLSGARPEYPHTPTPQPAPGGNSGYPDVIGYPHMPWPDTGVAPGVAPGQPARPVTPTPATAYPPTPPPRPRAMPTAAGPAAVRQQPNLGNYSPFIGISRPNADVVNRGGRSSDSGVQGTALDLSRLFGGGQPAPVAAPVAAPAPVAARAPAPIYKNPSIRQVFPTTPLGQGGIGSDARFPLRKPKSSSSSQGGGY
jgi:hypothetical protein